MAIPTALDDNATTNEDTAFSGNVLANDTDPDTGDTLTVSAVNGNTANVGTQITLASGALLTLNANGSFDYNPNGRFESLAVGRTATNSFNYTISDGNGGTDTATVTVTINGVNDAATIATITGAPTASVTEDATTPNLTTRSFLTLTDVDAGENLFKTTVTSATGNLGSLSSNIVQGRVNTIATYTYSVANSAVQFLGAGQTKAETFTVESLDGTATLDIVFPINGVNDAPVAGDDSASANQNTPVTLLSADLLANDTDVDGGPLSITAVSNGVNGTVSLNGSGNVVFTPTTNFTGDGSFDYTVSDGSLTDTATVTVAVGGNINGGAGNDSINGGAGNDSINGGAGNDSINGGAGNDSIIGGAGNDSITGGAGNDSITGDAGNDSIIGGAGNDSITGDAGNDSITGDAGNDSITGGAGNDSITGGAGNDSIIGGNDNDLLYGGIGSDFLTGNNGNDTFAFAAGDGTDTITDFTNQDLIGLYDGLSFGQLSFSGSNILVTSTNEILATLTGINTTTLTAADFVTL